MGGCRLWGPWRMQMCEDMGGWRCVRTWEDEDIWGCRYVMVFKGMDRCSYTCSQYKIKNLVELFFNSTSWWQKKRLVKITSIYCFNCLTYFKQLRVNYQKYSIRNMDQDKYTCIIKLRIEDKGSNSKRFPIF